MSGSLAIGLTGTGVYFFWHTFQTYRRVLHACANCVSAVPKHVHGYLLQCMCVCVCVLMVLLLLVRFGIVSPRRVMLRVGIRTHAIYSRNLPSYLGAPTSSRMTPNLRSDHGHDHDRTVVVASFMFKCARVTVRFSFLVFFSFFSFSSAPWMHARRAALRYFKHCIHCTCTDL